MTAECWPSAVGADDATVAKVTEMIMQQQQARRISWLRADERWWERLDAIISSRCGFFDDRVAPVKAASYTGRSSLA